MKSIMVMLLLFNKTISAHLITHSDHVAYDLYEEFAKTF
jgi:hypothetical protein